MGRKPSVLYPKLRVFMLSRTGRICSKMPQEYKDDSFSPKEFWFRHWFLWIWLFSIHAGHHLSVRGWEKWTQLPLITVMKRLMSLFSLTVTYTEISSSLYHWGQLRAPNIFCSLKHSDHRSLSSHLLFCTPTTALLGCCFKICRALFLASLSQQYPFVEIRCR